MELYCAADAAMEPRDGEKVMEAQALSLTLENGLLTAVLTDAGGTEETLCLSLRSGDDGAGAAPAPGLMLGAAVPDDREGAAA